MGAGVARLTEGRERGTSEAGRECSGGHRNTKRSGHSWGGSARGAGHHLLDALDRAGGHDLVDHFDPDGASRVGHGRDVFHFDALFPAAERVFHMPGSELADKAVGGANSSSWMRQPNSGSIWRSPGWVPKMIDTLWRMFSSYSDIATPPPAGSKWNGNAKPLPRNSFRIAIHSLLRGAAHRGHPTPVRTTGGRGKAESVEAMCTLGLLDRRVVRRQRPEVHREPGRVRKRQHARASTSWAGASRAANGGVVGRGDQLPVVLEQKLISVV